MNMKRESKVYSYKDQLEEMQLRRELEEKRRKEGKIKEPQYTVKQLEAIKNQRIKEQAIRDRLTKVIFFSLTLSKRIILKLVFSCIGQLRILTS